MQNENHSWSHTGTVSPDKEALLQVKQKLNNSFNCTLLASTLESRNISIIQTEIVRKSTVLIKTWKQTENWHCVKKHLVVDSA